MREYFCAYHSMKGAMRKLSDAECGRLFRALLTYSSGEQPDNLQGREELLFDVFAQQIDRDAEKYRLTCETNKANASGRTRSQANASGRTRSQANASDGSQEKEEEKEEYTPPTPSKGEGAAGAAAYIEQHLRAMTPGNWDELRSYLDDGITTELICHAVDEAAAQEKRSWAYVRGILNRYLTSGIRTVEQAKTEKTPQAQKPKTKTITEKIVVDGEIVDWTHEVTV